MNARKTGNIQQYNRARGDRGSINTVRSFCASVARFAASSGSGSLARVASGTETGGTEARRAKSGRKKAGASRFCSTTAAASAHGANATDRDTASTSSSAAAGTIPISGTSGDVKERGSAESSRTSVRPGWRGCHSPEGAPGKGGERGVSLQVMPAEKRLVILHRR